MSQYEIPTASEAAITQRFFRVDPDATSAYDITPIAVLRRDQATIRRRLARATRQEIAGLRAAIAAGWDVGPELAYEEQQLAALDAR